MDSEIHATLNSKIAPLFAEGAAHDCVDVFQDILSNKGVPRLGYLYSKGIVSLPDILKMRDNIDGILFRKWYASTDYDTQTVLKVLLNKVQGNLQSVAARHIRWLYPKIIGILNPIAGITSSYVESFVVDKILKPIFDSRGVFVGYKPALLLDRLCKISNR